MENIKVLEFKKLDKRAIIPVRGSEEAAGLDLCALGNYPVYKGCVSIIHTGLAVSIPKGYYGAVCSRSGNVYNFGLIVANQPGIIDSDYRGEIKVLVSCINDKGAEVVQGQRIAQLIIQPYSNINSVEVNELDGTERGSGGFGSTGQ
jgi:dUTP pyrophosphatase